MGSDYLASSLVNPDPEIEQGVQAFVDARAAGGNPMSPEEEEEYRKQMLMAGDPTEIGSAAWHAQDVEQDPAAHTRLGKYPSGEVVAGEREAGRMPPAVNPLENLSPHRFTPEQTSDMSETMGDVFRTEPTLEEVLGDPSSGSVPPPPVPDVIPDETPAPAAAAAGGGIRAVRAPDGRIIFTNVGAGQEGAPGGEEVGYSEAVGEFRDEMRDDILKLGAPPEGTTRTPGGHMLGDPSAPIPTEFEGPLGGDSIDLPWEEMTPGAQRAYLQSAAEKAAGQQASAAGTMAEHEATMATDPEYRAEQRTYLFDSVKAEAEQNPAVLQQIQSAMAVWQQQFPDIAEGSPEYEAAMAAIQQETMAAYLNRAYAAYAPWDDVFSRNTGLTIGNY